MSVVTAESAAEADVPTRDPGAALTHIYTEYYGLSEHPFAITPDPRFLFMSQRHRDALAHLLFSVKQGGGFVQLTGEVGTGKTTLTRALLAQLPPNVTAAIILNPKQTAFEFVQSICDELKVPYGPGTTSIKTLTDALNTWLLAAHERGQRTLVLIDEAQNLEVGVLEQIRLLTNLETTKEKLLQIILVGQPELRLMLERRDLRQLAQRITARYHLLPLSERETAEMVKHRLAVAGFTQHLFAPGALAVIHRASKGVPRLINVICDRALLGAYAENRRVIDRRIALRATAEVFGEEQARQMSRHARIAAWGLGALVIAGVAALLWLTLRPDTPAAVAPAVAVPDSPPAATEPPAIALEPAPMATPPPAVVPDPPPRDFGATLNDPALRTDFNGAMAALFGLWNADLGSTPGATACERARAVGLSCFTSKARLKPMLALNHPAVLKLHSASGAEHYAVLTHAGERGLTLQINGDDFTVPATTLESVWRGDYVLLWRKPDIGVTAMQLGFTGRGVRWLRDTLDRIEGTASATDSPLVYDDILVARVKAVQKKLGIPADGIVGERTMIRLLGAAPDASMPKLQERG